MHAVLHKSIYTKVFFSIYCNSNTTMNTSYFSADLPVWNFDGSSTGQADGHNSDTFLVPRAIYKDPFRRGNHILVMCDTFKYNMEPTGDFP